MRRPDGTSPETTGPQFPARGAVRRACRSLGAGLAGAALVLLAASCGEVPVPDGTSGLDHARSLADEGDIVTASRLLRQRLRSHPADSAAYGILADVQRSAKWHEEGYRLFRRYHERNEVRTPAGNPIPELRYYLAYFAAATGRLDSARQLVAEAMQVRPPTVAEAVSLSDVFLRSRPPQALAVLAPVWEGVPVSPARVGIRRSRALARLGRTEAAQALADSLVAAHPGRGATLRNAALLAFTRGDTARSRRLTGRWMIAEPGRPAPLWNLVRLALRRGDWGRADTLLSRVVASGR